MYGTRRHQAAVACTTLLDRWLVRHSMNYPSFSPTQYASARWHYISDNPHSIHDVAYLRTMSAKVSMASFRGPALQAMC